MVLTLVLLGSLWCPADSPPGGLLCAVVGEQYGHVSSKFFFHKLALQQVFLQVLLQFYHQNPWLYSFLTRPMSICIFYVVRVKA